MSHIAHFDFWSARYSFMDFGKTAIYYLLFVSIVNTPRRLESFLRVLILLLGFMTSLSLLNDRGILDIPQLTSIEQRDEDAVTGQPISYSRLQSTGIFNDPNDFAMILAIGIVLGASFLLDGNLLSRSIWLILIAAFLYAMVLTKSRGGFLALFAAIGFLVYSRWGWKRAAIAGGVMLPLLVAVFAMRNDGGIESGTGQARLQLWAEGFNLLRHSPLFGIGHNMYAEEVGHVAHNSFVHTYVELGLFGGTFFFGCFFFGLRSLWTQCRLPEIYENRVARRRTTLIMGILVAAAASMYSLSRAYGLPAYLVFGLGAVAAEFNGQQVPFTIPRINFPTLKRLAVASIAFISATYIYMRVMVHWG
jgi:hypothetical protein